MYKHRVLITEEEIRERCKELARTLNTDYQGRTLDIICTLKGAVFFAADLMRELTIPVRLHFIQVSSYGSSTENSGTIHLHFSSAFDLQHRDVLLVEDILDTGITLDYLVKHLSEKNPSSLKTCILLDKPERRKLDINPDYKGFEIPDVFVIGYGLDYNEFGRNLSYIAELDPSEYGK